MYLDCFPFTQFLEFFTCVGYIGNYYGGLGFVVICCAAVVGVGSGGVGLLVGRSESVLPLVEGPRGELAVFEYCFDMFKFLIHAVLG